MKAPYTENGLRYCFNSAGDKVCTGAMMGRPTIVPPDYAGERLNLRRVPLQDGDCYDPGGAYWGSPSNLWCAWGQTETEQMQVFVRAPDRATAKVAVAKVIRGECRATARFKS